MSSRIYEIEVQRTQSQIVKVKAGSLAEAIAKVDRRDYVFDEAEWSTFKDAWVYRAPVDMDGRYYTEGEWEEQ